MRKFGTIALALVILAATSAAAQQVYTGTVLRIDPAAGVVVLHDGRMFQTTADTVIISGNQRLGLNVLSQGTPVTLYSAQPVIVRDGRYMLLSDAAPISPAPSVVVPAPPLPPAVVVTPPAAAVVAPPATAVVTPAPVTTVPSGTQVVVVHQDGTTVVIPAASPEFIDADLLLLEEEVRQRQRP